MDTIKKRVGNKIYKIKGPQIRKRLSDDADSGPPEEKDVLDVINDTFDMSIPQGAPEKTPFKEEKENDGLYRC